MNVRGKNTIPRGQLQGNVEKSPLELSKPSGIARSGGQTISPSTLNCTGRTCGLSDAGRRNTPWRKTGALGRY
eukprot:1918881-Rhodomonas_salina.5